MTPIAPTRPHALRLLGGFELDCGSQRHDPVYVRGRALLAYLATQPGRPHARASLAAMFWPGLARPAALANLRLVLHDLRLALGRSVQTRAALQTDHQSIRFSRVPGLDIDVLSFSTPLPACIAKPCSAHCDPCMAQMACQTGRYQGQFMAGFSLPECPDFEAWLQVHREALHQRALFLLARLADCHQRFGACDKSLPFALRCLALDPSNEGGLRRAMRLLALNGQRSAALAAHEHSCRAMKQELGVAPSEETQALADHIRLGAQLPGGTDG